MSQRIDPTTWFTRIQSDGRYVRKPTAPVVPTSLTAPGTDIVQTADEIYAYVNVQLVPPAAPAWSNVTQYVHSFEFTVSYTSAGTPVTKIFLLPYNNTNIYRIEPLPSGAALTITASTVDYLGQRSAASSPLNTSAAADTTAPGARTITVDLIAGGGAQINLNALNAESDFSHYELHRMQAGSTPSPTDVGWGFIYKFFATAVPDLNIPVAASNYYYKVVSKDLSGNGANSNVFGPVTLAATAQDPPASPNLAAGSATPQSDGTVLLQWPPLSDASLAFYVIYRRVTGTTSWLVLDKMSAVPNLPNPVTYFDFQAISGTQYDYTVTALNGVGDESPFPVTVLTATSADTAVPNPPSSITLIGRVGGVSLVWTKSTSGDVVAYGVSYRLNSLGAWSAEQRVLSNQANIYGISDSRETLANNLEVRIRAFDEVDNASSYATYIAGYPELAGYRPADNTVPAGPVSASAASADDGSVNVSFPASISADRSGYQVEKFDSVSSVWEIIGTIVDDQAGTKLFRTFPLEPYKFRSKQYKFRVRTLDYSGNISSVNLVSNPSFENNLTGWSTAGSPVVQGGGGRTGLKCIQASYLTYPYQRVVAAPGEVLSASGYVKTDSVAGAASILISWRNSGGSEISLSTSVPVSTSGSYQRASITAVAPSGTAFADIVPAGEPGNTSRTFIWDDIQFERTGGATAYNEAETGLISVVDDTGPQNYTGIGLSADGALGQINVLWTNPPAPPGQSSIGYDYQNGVFEVWRKITNTGGQPGLSVDGSFVKIAEVPAYADGAANRFVDTTPDEPYNVVIEYKLKARDQYGNVGPFLNSDTAATGTSKNPNDIQIARKDTLVPTTPGTATATANTDGTVGLSWSGSTTAGRNDLLGYRIYRKVPGTANYMIVGTRFTTSDGGTVTWTDSSLELDGGNTYDYKIGAVDTADEESTLSAASNSIVPVDNRAPNPPTSVVGRGTVGGLLVSWVASTTPGVTQYEIFVPAISGQPSQTFRVTGTSAVATLLGGPSAISTRMLDITVKAVSRSGSTLSSAVTMTDVPANEMYSYIPVDKIAPGSTSVVATPVTYSTYTRTSGVVTIVFAAAHGMVAGDSIIVGTNVISADPPDGTFIVETIPNTTTITYIDDRPNASFTFGGPADISVNDLFSFLSNTNGSVTLEWGPSFSNDVKGYSVEISQETGEGTETGGTYAQAAVVFAPTNSVRITGLEPTVITGKRYRFRVRVFDTADNLSAYTTTGWIAVYGDTSLPTTPTNLTLTTSLDIDAEGTTAVVNATWERVEDRDLSQYVLDYYRTDGTGGITSVSIAGYMRTYTVTGLKVSKQYSFTIRSRNLFGRVSAASTSVLVTTPTPPVANTTPGAPGLSSITKSDADTTSEVTVNITAGYGGSSANGPHSADNDLSYHAIYRSFTNGVEGTQIGTLSIPSNSAFGAATSFVETLGRSSDGSSYTAYYTIRTVDTSGSVSAASSQSSISIPGYPGDGGGGGGGPLDPLCPTLDMFIGDRQVKHLKVGDRLTTLENGRLTQSPILEMLFGLQECVRLETLNGCSKEVSISTPIILKDGFEVKAPDVLGLEVATLTQSKWRRWFRMRPVLTWSRVCKVIPIGLKQVALLNLGGKVFAGGTDRDRMIFTHNNIPFKDQGPAQ
jgi:fibronectin type 3 domain-containing protein